ncbi:abcF2 [Symbiodinium sp. CCMP2592]|nr:abcF2 [Symbiodinium sp. CCMP2592]
MAAAVRIAKVECSKYSTTLAAASHGFPAGARIKVEGLPELQRETFIVNRSTHGRFSIWRNVCVEIASVDPSESIVRTTSPHKISNYMKNVTLHVFDTDIHLLVEKVFNVEEVVDDSSLRLKAWCGDHKTWYPAKLSANWAGGSLSMKHCDVVLPQSQCTGSGVATLACRPPVSEELCIHDWHEALRAVRGCVSKEVPPVTRPVLPGSSLLHVQYCGWDHCIGVFQRTSEMKFDLGPLVSIIYVDQLKLWCLLADVEAVHPLCERRWSLGLSNFDGPQLLYVRKDASPLGRWEPVIGPGPGPLVSIYKEVSIVQPASRQTSMLMHPSSCSVLDMLLNYTHADWRGGRLENNVWGLSSLEGILTAVSLWRELRVCSAVCQSWQAALKPFASLTRMCYHALRIPQGINLPMPSLQDIVQAIVLSANTWMHGLHMIHLPIFLDHAWPARVSSVELSAEMGNGEEHFMSGPTAQTINKHAAAASQVAQQILRGVPLPWKVRPYTTKSETRDGRRHAGCELLDFHHEHAPEKSAAEVFVHADTDGHMQLGQLDGTELLPHSTDALGPLINQGLSVSRVTRRWASTYHQPRADGEPCGFPFCRKLSFPCHVCSMDKEGRTRLGASQLSSGYVLHFLTADAAEITLEISVDLIPFFATSKDPSLVEQLLSAVPWGDDEEEEEEEGEEEAEEADEEAEEEDELDVEDLQAGDLGYVRWRPPRRRLVGKQRPPESYRS